MQWSLLGHSWMSYRERSNMLSENTATASTTLFDEALAIVNGTYILIFFVLCFIFNLFVMEHTEFIWLRMIIY